jgi:cation diffusion facilitator CzcD-associated flavoprotein CzcO
VADPALADADDLRDRDLERTAIVRAGERLARRQQVAVDLHDVDSRAVHPYASKRPPFETDYYETYNLPHVDLVNVRSAPIEAITPAGIRTSEASYEFDAIVLATGFDVFTGPLLSLGITGRDGVRLEEKWSDGPISYLGIQTAGCPNLFTILGPSSAAALYNVPLAIEDHVDFTVAAIGRAQADGARTFEATPEAERVWRRLAEGILNMTGHPTGECSLVVHGRQHPRQAAGAVPVRRRGAALPGDL